MSIVPNIAKIGWVIAIFKKKKVFLQQHLENLLGSQKGSFPGWLLCCLFYCKNDTSLFSVQIK